MLTLKNTELLEIMPYKPYTKYLVKWRKRQEGTGDQVINWNGLRSFAHREVLLASSDYFKMMFSGNFHETNQPEITLSKVFDDVNIQNAVIDYMYNGNIILSFKNILNILNVATLFLMHNLQEACVVFLKSNLSPITSLHIYTIADRYNLLGLQAACMEVIVPWFPLNLWKSDMALDISPHCLVSLVEGNLFELVPDDMSTTFLHNWCVNFESMNDIDAEVIPQKVKDLLRRHRQLGPTEVGSPELLASMSTPRQDCREYDVQLEGGEEEDEVLYTVFTSPPTNSCNCNVEVHALIPLLKKWKLVLRHSFNFFVKSTAVPSLLGVTKTAAFFLLRAMDMKPRMDCIIAVTLEKNEEIVINVPERLQTKSNNYEFYGRNACFFLWDEQLCMIVSVHGMTFGLYRNVHIKGQCVGCVGECWDMLCRFHINDSAEYLVKTYKGELYVWTKQYAVVGHMLTHMSYTMSKVQKFPHGYKVILLSGARDDYSVPEGSTGLPQTDLTVMCDIIADPKADTLTFIHVVRKHLPDGDLIDSWQNSHVYRQMTYSVSDDIWRTDMDWTLDYPDPPSLIKTWRKYKTSLPLQQYCKRLVCSSDSDSDTTDESDSDHEYFNQRVKKKGPEICIGGLYYAKTTSAYNSSVWRLQPILRKWTLVGRLPYSLERFKNCLRSEASKDWLSELPDSHFRDFSPELGQNASWMPEIVGTGMRATFYSNVLPDDVYAKRWCALWQECYAQK